MRGVVTNPFDAIIVGGGLSGLLVARELNVLKKSWKLLEARPTVGGRLENDASEHKIDLGGAWIWPQHHPHIKHLVKSLGIETFSQPDDPSSTRMNGGAVALVERIVNELEKLNPEGLKPNCDDDKYQNIETNSIVVAVKRLSTTPIENSNAFDTNSPPEECISVKLASGRELYAKKVVFAAPPKILSLYMQFEPPLPSIKAQAMASSQTWMAGVTKVALVYNSPRFWPLHESNSGFRPGPRSPAFQVYDASPKDGLVSALTFFSLASLSQTEKKSDVISDELLAKQCAMQMVHNLSPSTIREHPDIVRRIKAFDSFHVKHWPHEKYISEDNNPDGINPHPQPNPELARSEWDGVLLFAGTETDQSSPGVMEGAVGAALRVVNELKKSWST